MHELQNEKIDENDIGKKLLDETLSSDKHKLPEKEIESPLVTSKENDIDNMTCEPPKKKKRHQKTIFNKFI